MDGLESLTRPFPDVLQSWTDFDVAAFALGRALGLFDGGPDAFREAKHVFWSRNDLGDALHKALCALADAGVLASDPSYTRFAFTSQEAIARTHDVVAAHETGSPDTSLPVTTCHRRHQVRQDACELRGTKYGCP